MSDFISYRAFAKLDKCSENLVRRGVKEQRLPVGPEGGIDAAFAGSGWRQGNVTKAANSNANSVRTLDGESAEDAAARVTDGAPVIPAYAVSMARKEFFLANLRQIEAELKAGTVVLVEDTVRLVGEQLARVRTRLLAIPSGCAAQVHRAKTTAQVDALISDAIHQALEELVADAAP